MADIIIPPRRDESPIETDGQLTIRFATYLEELGRGTNEFELRITENTLLLKRYALLGA